MPNGFKAEFAADHSIVLRSDEIQVPLGTAAGFRMFVLTLREMEMFPSRRTSIAKNIPLGKTTPGMPEWGTTGRCAL